MGNFGYFQRRVGNITLHLHGRNTHTCSWIIVQHKLSFYLDHTCWSRNSTIVVIAPRTHLTYPILSYPICPTRILYGVKCEHHQSNRTGLFGHICGPQNNIGWHKMLLGEPQLTKILRNFTHSKSKRRITWKFLLSVPKERLSCYLVLLSTDRKNRSQDSRTFTSWPDHIYNWYLSAFVARLSANQSFMDDDIIVLLKCRQPVPKWSWKWAANWRHVKGLQMSDYQINFAINPRRLLVITCLGIWFLAHIDFCLVATFISATM